MRRLSFLCFSYLILRKRNLTKSSLMRCCGAFSHCFVLTLVGAKHTSDFQIHLDIQNKMLVIISNVHIFNKTFVHVTNNAAIFPWYHFWFDILTAILLKNDTKIPMFEKWLAYWWNGQRIWWIYVHIRKKTCKF